MKVNTEVRNARILFSALALVLAPQVARARQVINGDVIYPVTARAATEKQSVLDAQTRAAHGNHGIDCPRGLIPQNQKNSGL